MNAEKFIRPKGPKFVVEGTNGFKLSLGGILTRGSRPQLAKLIHSKTNGLPLLLLVLTHGLVIVDADLTTPYDTTRLHQKC